MMQATSPKEAKALGASRYFTGVPCRNGHVAERRAGDRGCVACDQTKRTRHYYGDREDYLRKQRLRQEANRESCREASARWRSNNREVIAEYNKAYKTEHRDMLSAYDRERRAANPEKQREQQRAWVERNRGQKNALSAARRARIKQAMPPWLTSDDKAAIKALYDHAAELSRSTGTKHHVDHIIPLNGELVSGLHVPGNLRVITASENSRKRNKFIQEIASGERVAVETGTGINPGT